MRQVYRNKLLQFIELSNKDDQQIGLQIKSKEELLRTYNEKEIDLSERLQREKEMSLKYKQQNKALQIYSQQLKQLAEDWAPHGAALPDILRKDYNINLDERQLVQTNMNLQKQINKMKESYHKN